MQSIRSKVVHLSVMLIIVGVLGSMLLPVGKAGVLAKGRKPNGHPEAPVLQEREATPVPLPTVTPVATVTARPEQVEQARYAVYLPLILKAVANEAVVLPTPTPEVTVGFVSVVVEPAILEAGQSGTAFVFVADEQGNAVPDGSRVTLSAVGGTVPIATGETKEGLVRIRVTAGQKTGAGQVTARVGSASGSGNFTIAAAADGISRVSAAVTSAPSFDPARVIEQVRNPVRAEGTDEWAVENPKYRVDFGASGIAFASKTGEGAMFSAAAPPSNQPLFSTRQVAEAETYYFEFQLTRIARGAETLYQRQGTISPTLVANNEISYRHGDTITETYRARNDALQQLITLSAPLSGTGDLLIEMDLDTNLLPQFISEEEGALFFPAGAITATSEALVRYTGAIVEDATGRETLSEFAVENGVLRLIVPGGWLDEAHYPVTIDPMIGDPTLVSDPRAVQDEFALAYNPDADEYLVVWGGYDTGGASQDIQGQRLAADGTFLGGVITVTNAVADQKLPAIIYNGIRHEYLVVWSDYRDDPDGDIYARRLSADGSLLGGDFLVAGTEALQDTPAVAYNPNDDVYLTVWRDKESGTVQLYGQIISASGVLSGNHIVLYNQSGEVRQPRVAYNASSGEFVAVWSHHDSAIYGQWLSGTGQLLDNPDTTADERDPAVPYVINDDVENQYQPALAVDSSTGTMLVSWSDKRSDRRGDIYGQLMTAGRVLSGTDFLVGGTANATQNQVAVAYNATQDAYLTIWRDYRNHRVDLYGQFIHPTGVLSGNNFILYNEGAKNQYPHLVANTQSGGYLTGWLDLQEYTNNIYGSLLNASGQTAGEPFLVGPKMGLKAHPAVVFNGIGQTYLLVWEDEANGDGGIFAKRMDELGQATGERFQVSTPFAGGGQTYPQAAATGESGYLVVWQDNRQDSLGDIYLQRISLTGTLVGENVVISAESGREQYPAIAYDTGHDLALVVWEDTRKVYGQLLTGSGVMSGTKFVISSNADPGSIPQIVFNKILGEYMVVWSYNQGASGYDIFAQRISPSGNLLDNPGTPENEADTGTAFLINSATDDQREPHLVVDGMSGTYLIIWADRRDYAGHYTDIYGQRIGSDGVLLGGEIPIATGTYRERYPVVATLGDEGDWLVVWTEDRSGWNDYGQRVSAGGELVADNELLVTDNYYRERGAGVAGPGSSAQLLLSWVNDGEIYAQRYFSPDALPMAGFSGSPLSGSVPLAVTFVNSSTNATDYVWQFGDGRVSTAINPVHTYTQTGVYTVSLTANGVVSSDTLTRSGYITVSEGTNLQLDFSATPVSGTVPLTVTFSEIVTPAGQYTTTWTFGDGTTETAISPTHSYTRPGVYTVSLTVGDMTRSASLTKTRYITAAVDVSAFNWRLVTTTHTIPVVGEGALGYDTVRQQAIWYGGNATGYPYETGMWAFDGSDWAVITPTLHPPVRYGMAMVYDRTQDRLLLFGGSDRDDQPLDETWVYSATAGTWTQRLPVTAPLSRTNAAMAVDPASGKIYLFGGNNGETYFNDLWVYANEAWQAVVISGTVPPPRTLAAIDINPADGSLLLFGGRSVTGTALADTWQFDPVTSGWQRKSVAGPPARYAHTLTYDPMMGRFVLVGGSAEAGDTLFGDTWVYAPATGWEAPAPATSPPPLAYHRAVYDETGNALILVGNGEVWRYEQQ